MRGFSRYLSRCLQPARHFHFPRLISAPWLPLSEPWLFEKWVALVAAGCTLERCKKMDEHFRDLYKSLSVCQIEHSKFLFVSTNFLGKKSLLDLRMGEPWRDTQLCIWPELRTKDAVYSTDVSQLRWKRGLAESLEKATSNLHHADIENWTNFNFIQPKPFDLICRCQNSSRYVRIETFFFTVGRCPSPRVQSLRPSQSRGVAQCSDCLTFLFHSIFRLNRFRKTTWIWLIIDNISNCIFLINKTKSWCMLLVHLFFIYTCMVVFCFDSHCL